jgi:hypothetical protein
MFIKNESISKTCILRIGTSISCTDVKYGTHVTEFHVQDRMIWVEDVNFN